MPEAHSSPVVRQIPKDCHFPHVPLVPLWSASCPWFASCLKSARCLSASSPAVCQLPAARQFLVVRSLLMDDIIRLPPCLQGPPLDAKLMPRCLLLISVLCTLDSLRPRGSPCTRPLVVMSYWACPDGCPVLSLLPVGLTVAFRAPDLVTPDL
ncbi:hypothetical protein CB1_000726005 [Camelus ferus]|nr:hypothetical protein CB1_000726005 [Camelus ferus]